MPFQCWNASYKDFFTQLLHCFCKDEHISESKKFGELPPQIQEKLLRGKGTTKYKISYSAGGRKRTKTSPYIGPIAGLESNTNDMFGLNRDKYASPHICPDCHGSRLNAKTNALTVYKKTTVLQLLTSNLSDVHVKLVEYEKSRECSSLSLSPRSAASLFGSARYCECVQSSPFTREVKSQSKPSVRV